MISYNKIFLTALLLTSTFLFQFCSSSSDTIRYGRTESEEKPQKNSSVRFTSEDDQYNSGDSLLVFDADYPEELDPSDLPDDSSSLSVVDVLGRYKDSSGELLSANQNTAREKVMMEIIKYMDTPYKFGGNTIDGIDCSAFTQLVYREGLSLDLNRTAREQFKQGEVIKNKEDLKFGDLVFFNTRRRVRPGHVGIYIGDNLFAHASTKQGVTITSLDHEYYAKRYMGARRIETNGELSDK